MSYGEFLNWISYIQKRGSLNLGLRLERGFALLAYQNSQIHGGKAEMEDFMPHFDKQALSLAEAMKAWS